MTRALVTGAAGFIGSHVVDHLISRDVEVVATDNLSGGHIDNVHDDAIWRPANLASQAAVECLFEEYEYDHVYHLGAYAAEGLSHYIRGYNYQTNLMASVNLINQSILQKVKRFIFASSIAVYGKGHPPYCEDHHPAPEDPYGISKYAVELDLIAAFKQFHLQYTIFRPHNVYGPRQNISDPYRNVIGIFIRQCLNGEPMTIFGDGTQLRAFSYIDSVAKPIADAPFIYPQEYVRATSTANQILNVGADVTCTMLELSKIVAEVCSVDHMVCFLPARNEVKVAHSDHKKIKEIYKPIHLPKVVNLKTGIQRTVAHIREFGIPEPTYFREAIEVPINLPPSWEKVAAKVSNQY